MVLPSNQNNEKSSGYFCQLSFLHQFYGVFHCYPPSPSALSSSSLLHHSCVQHRHTSNSADQQTMSSSHLGSPLLFARSQFCTLVESAAASYISECNYCSTQGTCRVTSVRSLFNATNVTLCTF
ncbi:uncharacterized protein [Solanum lycopersicum]|uniref:Uncharacterized protein LOC107031890 isoform X2 n=1 Tax=Solanum pennellii TaxID=28526 RepID=A0ABM1HQG9_SOLPN|nr:uncharacterized protein LOC104646718 [Solanum lycopersicum]XP_015088870.1 uncharacterized protein LOC107031890 isoform X2 [Solanum pennellii]